MSEAPERDRTSETGGFLRRFGDSLLGLLQTRMEILSLEWHEERRNLVRLLLAAICILACLHLALVLGLVYLLMVVDEEHRVTVLGSAALVLLVVVAIGVLGLVAWIKRRPPMFGTTVAELRKDRELIRKKS